MIFGTGYDSFKDESSGSCVDITKLQYDGDKLENTIQESIFKIDLIESSHELAKKLKITTSASLKVGFGRGSAAASYVDEQQLNQYSLYILVSAEVLTPSERSVGELLNADYIDLAKSNPDAFRLKCGNEYVAAVQRGGSFYGLLKLETADSTTYNQIKLDLRAKVGTFKTASELEKSVAEATRNKNLQIIIHHVGGKDNDYPINVEQLLRRITQFPSEITKNKIPLKVVTVPYTQLKNYPLQATAFDTSVRT